MYVMSKTWVMADPHFGHANILNFNGKDGNKLRPFNSVEEMDDALVANWNNLVGKDDRAYLLGDIAMRPSALHTVSRLNGRLVLVKGNHDEAKLSRYAELFDDVRAYVVKKGLIMSHIPIHPGSLSRWQFNVHGHLHDNTVGDDRYICVSVEQTDYKPVDMQTIYDRLVEVPRRNT